MSLTYHKDNGLVQSLQDHFIQGSFSGQTPQLLYLWIISMWLNHIGKINNLVQISHMRASHRMTINGLGYLRRIYIIFLSNQLSTYIAMKQKRHFLFHWPNGNPTTQSLPRQLLIRILAGTVVKQACNAGLLYINMKSLSQKNCCFCHPY